MDKVKRTRRDGPLDSEEAARLRDIREAELADRGTGADFIAFLSTTHSLGELLRSARENAGLSLADMAERTGMTKPALSRLETGDRENPTLATINRYATALGRRVRLELVEDE